MKSHCKLPRRRVQNFLLLELTIALFLVTLCLLPMLKTHIGMHRLEAKRIQTMQFQALANLALIDLKTELFEGKIPWKKLDKRYSGQLEGTARVFIGKHERLFPRRYTLETIGHTFKKKLKRKYRTLRAKIFFTDDQAFFFTFLIEKETE